MAVRVGPMPCMVCRRLVVWDGEFLTFVGTSLIHNEMTCPEGGQVRIRKVGEVQVPRAVREAAGRR